MALLLHWKGRAAGLLSYWPEKGAQTQDGETARGGRRLSSLSPWQPCSVSLTASPPLTASPGVFGMLHIFPGVLLSLSRCFALSFPWIFSSYLTSYNREWCVFILICVFNKVLGILLEFKSRNTGPFVFLYFPLNRNPQNKFSPLWTEDSGCLLFLYQFFEAQWTWEENWWDRHLIAI